uniref:Agenet domain-containing protein n=1 Tax=Brassica oleracea var. oleracea TaxID=109376 RepID=A0A0D3AUW8_BRAOL
MEKNLKKKGKLFSIAKDCEVEVSLQEDGFKGSWFRAILEQNPMRVKGKKLRVCYKTLFNEDGVNPCKETIERCFIRSVPPECLNEGVVFKEGSVVDAYFNNGWWTGLIIVERPDGSFFIYFDDPPDIMRFIRSQLRPPANWIGSEWVKSKNKVLSQHIFRTGKLIEMTPEISEKYSLNDFVEVIVTHGWRKGRVTEILLENNYKNVEVVVTHGWRKGRVMEILLENNYKVYFAATKEDAIFNYTEIRLSMEWLGGGSWIRAHEREFENNAVTPIRPAQESPSNTLVLESNEDDTVNDDATEIKSSRESHSNTSFLEATETETQNHEPVDGVELPLPHESDDMMDDVATPIIDPQEIPRDPELHSDLVEDVDSEFGRVVDLVKRGYRLKREDWLNGSVDIAVAEAEVDENNSAPGIDATDQEKIKFLTKMVVSLEEKVKYLEGLLNIRGETVKETEKSKETEADTKTKGKKNGVRPPREVDHQDEDDIEVEHGAKESDTSKVNEPQEENKHHEEDDTEVDVDDSAKGNENSETNKGHTQEEEEQQQEDDTEVNADVDVGAKESENSETNEDGEVNEDASKKPVKVTKKCGRGNKGKKKSVKPPREVQQQVEDDAEIGAKESENPETNEGKKKSVKPPREVQQQVEDDAEIGAKESENPETNEDGEMNEDASKKPVKVTKKRGRGNKGMKKGVTPPREVQQQVEDDADVDVGAFIRMKKCVTPPREVQQQVEDDAEVDAKESENPKTDEDGEVNEDASKKQVKFTKKRGRVTKEPNVDTSKSKRQKKQEDSAADAIGRVLEDLKKNQLEASRI